MVLELPPECKMPPEWVEVTPHGRGVGYKCPQAVKALMNIRVPDKTRWRGTRKIGASGVAEYVGVTDNAVWRWSSGGSMELASFKGLCRLWNEHHED